MYFSEISRRSTPLKKIAPDPHNSLFPYSTTTEYDDDFFPRVFSSAVHDIDPASAIYPPRSGNDPLSLNYSDFYPMQPEPHGFPHVDLHEMDLSPTVWDPSSTLGTFHPSVMARDLDGAPFSFDYHSQNHMGLAYPDSGFPEDNSVVLSPLIWSSYNGEPQPRVISSLIHATDYTHCEGPVIMRVGSNLTPQFPFSSICTSPQKPFLDNNIYEENMSVEIYSRLHHLTPPVIASSGTCGLRHWSSNNYDYSLELRDTLTSCLPYTPPDSFDYK